jgi:uncharacterized protein YajQ (UPF0234 family)
VLEHRVAVAEGALGGIEREAAAGVQVDGVERFEAVLQLDAVGADVLHRRAAHGARDQRQVLEAGIAVAHHPFDRVVPDLARAGFHDPGPRRLFDQPQALDFHLEHQRLDVAGQHDVAAAAQHETGGALPVGAGQELGDIGLIRDARQALRARDDAETVVRLQGDVVLHDHGRIVASSTSESGEPMPSFDTVCEPNLPEVKNAVENTAKEIATRFDFKGTAAAVDLKDKEITMIGDAEFQLVQVEDILRSKLTKRSVDVRFLDKGDVQKMGGDKVKQVIKVKSGIESEQAKKITRIVKDSKLKVQAAIQGDAVRITGAKRDDLQAAMALIKKDVPDMPLSFNNFRD